MRDYSRVGPKFWIGSTGKRLRSAGMEAQIVSMYLLTSPHANMLGLYYCPIMFIAHETGIGIEGASKGLNRSIEAGFCEYDDASEVVWVIEMAAYQVGPSLKPTDLRVKGVQNEYSSLPDNPFLYRFFEKYSASFNMEICRGKDGGLEAPSKPLASQEQEQEQEQEQDKKQCADKPARFDPLKMVLPDCIPSEAWASWIAYRRQRKLTCTEQTINGQLANLQAWHRAGHSVSEIINSSIVNGWQGLFAPKVISSAAPVRSGMSKAGASTAAAAEKWLESEGESRA